MRPHRWIASISVLLMLGAAGCSGDDRGHSHGKEEPSSPHSSADAHDPPGQSEPTPEGLAATWRALTGMRNAIAADVQGGRLLAVHHNAERLAPLASALGEHSESLDPAKRARVEGALKQVPRVADALHHAADRGDKARAERELKRLDGLLQLIEAQYPEAEL